MFPLELITAGGGFLLGMVSKLVTMKMEMKHQEQKALMDRAGLVRDAREFHDATGWFSWTRRTIALVLLATITMPMWGPLLGMFSDIDVSVGIPLVDKSDTTLLFGLFYYTKEATEYVYTTSMMFLPEYKHYFAAVMGLYFGAKR